MGIHRLSSKLHDIGIQCELLELSNIEDFDSKRVIVIDILNFYYKSIRSKNLKVLNKPHLQGIFNLLSYLMKHGFIPISVFDGKPPPAKTRVINSRKQHFKQHMENIEKRANSNSSLEMQQNTVISRDQIDEIMHMMSLLGLPYVKHDEYEAELVCAWLIQESDGKIFAALGDDWDLLALGCPVLRNLNFKASTVEYYNPIDICAKLNITQEMFVNFVMLLGTDYCDRVTGIGTLELLNVFKLNDGIIDKTIEFIRLHYSTGIKIPNVNYNDILKQFQIPDINFLDSAQNMNIVGRFLSYYNNPLKFKGFLKKNEFIKLRDQLIALLQMKNFIVSEKLEEIFPC
jgi:5'-3' exonuclease